ncbi:hypothetical protein LDENG_00234380, partial [Lucifuga dentata]
MFKYFYVYLVYFDAYIECLNNFYVYLVHFDLYFEGLNNFYVYLVHFQIQIRFRSDLDLFVICMLTQGQQYNEMC